MHTDLLVLCGALRTVQIIASLAATASVAPVFCNCTGQLQTASCLLLLLLLLCCCSSSGQVVLAYYPTGKKIRTLLPKGHRAGCLGFASSLLCGGKGSGQLLVWDVANNQDGPQEYDVHRVSAQLQATEVLRNRAGRYLRLHQGALTTIAVFFCAVKANGAQNAH